ncbi:hypothetical protein AURDEDRAFT_117365 [Auricularia subglabra TFB-10046 SS5]|uniref:MYND-type domain-containing protein n=1 Tax=Auricularia subglabra (strain TFB-10046 / SS5) TaxID=717982 RepID=J0LEZ4_AURST|nr:hypothetical protein AURDEDRAFT_117365 [Auricularia subglabra TFB-10046 SS5]
MASLLPDDTIDQYEWIGYLGTKLWATLQMDTQYHVIPGRQPPAYARGIETPDALKDPYRALRFYLQFRSGNRGCDGPGCGKTVHDKTTPGGFPRCSTCRAAQYCSRVCQDADWRRGAVPHKAVCRILRDLFAFVSPADIFNPAKFQAACAEHAFPLAHVDKLISWATEGKCAPNYASGVEQPLDVHWFVMEEAVALDRPPPEPTSRRQAR